MTSYANDERLLVNDDFLTPSLSDRPTGSKYYLHSIPSGGAKVSPLRDFGVRTAAAHGHYSIVHPITSISEETAGIIATPELVQAIAQGIEDFTRGDSLTSSELDELLARRER